MNYRDLKWSELRSFAKSQGIDTKGKKKVEILEELDNMNPTIELTEDELKHGFIDFINLPCDTKVKLQEFKGVKESHPLFEEVKPYLKSLKAYKKLKAVSNVEGQSKGIATLFMKYLEKDPNAVINLGCSRCISKYYERFVANYDLLCDEYGRGRI